jgi:hypothetical protein
LSWASSSDSLLRGYDIYRGASYGGSYELVGMVDGHSRYVDEGLLSEEDYYYYVCVRDRMGNVSAPSETAEVWTGAPYMPGWPGELRGASFPSPVVGDADHDGLNDVFVGSKGREVSGFDVYGIRLPGFPYEGSCEVWSSPVLVDLDGNGTLECITAESISNTAGKPHCTTVLAFNHDGSFVSPASNPLLPSGSPGWPQSVETRVRSSPAIGDLDKDGRPEVIVGTELGAGNLYAFRFDGSAYLDGSPVFAEVRPGIWATPCVYDLDGDGDLEIVVCGKDGNLYIWRHDGSAYIPGSGGKVDSTGVLYMSSPAIGNIDEDAEPEIVGVNAQGQVLAWNHDGTPAKGEKPVIAAFNTYTQSSPALADFDGDGKLEIAVGLGSDDGSLVLLRGDGTPYNDEAVILRWGFTLAYASPAIADIDDDDEYEIITCSEDGYVLAVNSDGSSVNGYPRKLEGFIYSSPVIDDLDRDGDMELLVAGYDSRLHVWDLSSPYSSERAPWPMFHHDRWHTGAYGFVAPTDTSPPTYAVAVYRNSVLDRVMDIYVVPREKTENTPVVRVSSAVGTDYLDVQAVPNADRVFKGHHLATVSAAETVYVSATDTYGNHGTESRIITYSTLVGEDLLVRSADGVLEARAAHASGVEVLAILPIDTGYLDPSGILNQDVDVKSCAYNLCVIDGQDADMRIQVLLGRGEDRSLYRYDGNQGWFLVEEQNRVGDVIEVEGAGPGIYAVGRARSVAIRGLRISGAAPNPFRVSCSVVVNASGGLKTEVSVFDVRGRLVRRIFSGPIAGDAQISWDGRDRAGNAVASGIYFFRARAGSMVATEKAILVR